MKYEPNQKKRESKLHAIGLKMESLVKKVDKLYCDARGLMGFDRPELGCWYEDMQARDMGAGLIEIDREANLEDGRNAAIELINEKMVELGITPDMLKGATHEMP